MLQRAQAWSTRLVEPTSWRRFLLMFLGTFVGGLTAVYVFVLLVDPYDVVPFSLPLERPIVSAHQRFVYPQIVRSGRFDSLIIGSSTARLIDPQALNGPFQARIANLSMNAMTAWEQVTMLDYFLRKVGPPKVLIVAFDARWCAWNADRVLTEHGFPLWMYDDNPWNDYLHLLNNATLIMTLRIVGYRFGLSRERIRYDGFQVFVPPESRYDLVRVRRSLWGTLGPRTVPDVPPPSWPEHVRKSLSFPAHAWLDATLAKLPPQTRIVFAEMPLHVVAQAWPGTPEAAIDAECKSRIAALARKYSAKLIDWRIVSPLTTNDSNYWDPVHYRLPVADRIARDLVATVLEGRPSTDGSYRIVVP